MYALNRMYLGIKKKNIYVPVFLKHHENFFNFNNVGIDGFSFCDLQQGFILKNQF